MFKSLKKNMLTTTQQIRSPYREVEITDNKQTEALEVKSTEW